MSVLLLLFVAGKTCFMEATPLASFALCVLTLVDDIVFVITKSTQLTRKSPKPF